MRRGPTVILELGERGMTAVVAVPSTDQFAIERVVTASCPEDLDATDPAAFGGWLRDEFRSEGIPKGKVVLALPRADVSIRVLELPPSDIDERPGLVSFAMARAAPFDTSEATIDFVLLPKPAPAASSDDDVEDVTQDVTPLPTAERVLAVAWPAAARNRALSVLKAANISADVACPRVFGLASLVEDSQTHSTRFLIDVGHDAVSFASTIDGDMVFSRVGALPPSSKGDPADAIATEVKRTWMACTLGESPIRPTEALVCAPGALATEVTERVAAAIGVPTRLLDVPADIAIPGENGDAIDRAAAWPLVGLVRPSPAPGAIDLLHPRRPNAKRAERRRIALLAAGLGIVLCGVALTLARGTLESRRSVAEDLAGQQRDLATRNAKAQREQARLMHIERWESLDGDFMSRLVGIDALRPDPRSLVLDGISVAIRDVRIGYDRREKVWRTPKSVAMSVRGEADSRQSADAFRESLVRTREYRATSTGRDGELGRRLPVAFAYQLESTIGAPPEDESE